MSPRRLKRLEDVALGSIALAAALPLMLVIALLIRLSGPGPVLFRQRRIGRRGRPFVIWKFRTLEVAAEGDARQVEADDRRITSVGRHLRRWGLDELPQLVNVLRGEMCLVGPRPYALAHDGLWSGAVAGWSLRRSVPPGITGLAQARGLRGAVRGRAEAAARLASDLEYVDHWSLLLDLRIMAATVVELLRPGGSAAFAAAPSRQAGRRTVAGQSRPFLRPAACVAEVRHFDHFCRSARAQTGGKGAGYPGRNNIVATPDVMHLRQGGHRLDLIGGIEGARQGRQAFRLGPQGGVQIGGDGDQCAHVAAPRRHQHRQGAAAGMACQDQIRCAGTGLKPSDGVVHRRDHGGRIAVDGPVQGRASRGRTELARPSQPSGAAGMGQGQTQGQGVGGRGIGRYGAGAEKGQPVAFQINGQSPVPPGARCQGGGGATVAGGLHGVAPAGAPGQVQSLFPARYEIAAAARHGQGKDKADQGAGFVHGVMVAGAAGLVCPPVERMVETDD